LIDIPDKESIRRLSARRQCPKDGKIYNMITAPPKNNETCDDCLTKLVRRDDDTQEAIQKRLDWYHKDTKPLVGRYEDIGVLHRIDGMPSISEVEKSVWKIFE
jgi:adenylate kinase